MNATDLATIEAAGMEADGGLAWLQAGHILSDGTPAPEWMQELNGYTIQGAAEKIRARKKRTKNSAKALIREMSRTLQEIAKQRKLGTSNAEIATALGINPDSPLLQE